MRATLGITERRRGDEPAPAQPSAGPARPSDLLARMRALKAAGGAPAEAPEAPPPTLAPRPRQAPSPDDDDDATTLLTPAALAARRAALLAEVEDDDDDLPEDGDVTMIIQRGPRPPPVPAPAPDARPRAEVWRPPTRK